MTIKAALIDWTTTYDVDAHVELLQHFAKARGKVNVLYDGDTFAAFSYEDNALDELEADCFGFECEIFDSLDELFERFDAEDELDLVGAMEHEDSLISCGRNAEDDADFAERLANLY